MRFNLSDDEWALLEPLLPKSPPRSPLAITADKVYDSARVRQQIRVRQ